MKTFHFLTQSLDQWRRRSNHHSLHSRSRKTNLSTIHAPTHSVDNLSQSSLEPLHGSFPPAKQGSKIQPPVMLLLSVVSLTSVVGYRFYNQPQLDVGKISPATVVAPSTQEVIDEQATEQRREEARTGKGIIPILKREASVTEQVFTELNNFFYQIDQLRELMGAFPFVEEQLLSLPTQRYLRNSKETEWQEILASLKRLAQKEQEQEQKPASVNPSKPKSPSQNSAMQQAIGELQSYRQKLKEPSFNNLLLKINNIRQGYVQAQQQIRQQPVQELPISYLITLIEVKDDIWQETKKGTTQVAKFMLTQGIPPGLPDNLLQEAVKTQLYFSVPAKTETIATEILLQVLQPNLAQDTEKTAQKAQQQAQDVEPVIIEIQQGEVIVKAGQTINHNQFVLLDYFDLSRRGTNWEGLLLCGGLVTTSVGVFWLIKRRVGTNLRRRDHILLWLLSISAPMLSVFKISYTSLPALGFLVGSFYGAPLAVPFIALLTGLVTFGAGVVGWDYLIAGAAGGLVAAVISGRLRSREELALLGGGVAITQGAVYLFAKLLLGTSTGFILYEAIPEAVFYSLSGLIWSIVALGVSPYLERLFDVVTPIRLAELSNPNRPLLKRLATEAPGTFQHTLFVASLAEAAARELRCNVELIRAGTLYHDIGKMHDPLGFIENQMGGPNKHDEINDPWKSAEIIKKHVSEGLVMARKYGLPKAIRDFIPEHQGTLLISYFYFQAKQREKEGTAQQPIDEADFRYEGPIPQSREAGILMLADGCEAALRSLKDATPETALALMQKIFKARWRDGQLAQSSLEKEELKTIAEVFVRVWQQSNHQRIAYPKAALEPNAMHPHKG